MKIVRLFFFCLLGTILFSADQLDNEKRHYHFVLSNLLEYSRDEEKFFQYLALYQEHGEFDINSFDEDGLTLAHRAAVWNKSNEFFRRLCNFGANLDKEAYSHEYPVSARILRQWILEEEKKKLESRSYYQKCIDFVLRLF